MIQIPSKIEELQMGFRGSMRAVNKFPGKMDYWASKQPIYIDVAVSIANGAVWGWLWHLSYYAKYPPPKMGDPVRVGAVLFATHQGISFLSMRLKGVKGVKGRRREPDAQTMVICAFTGAVVESLAGGVQLRELRGSLIPFLLISLSYGAFGALCDVSSVLKCGFARGAP